ncbi:hypothetical protein D3C85_1763490 [compost metagenome]
MLLQQDLEGCCERGWKKRLLRAKKLPEHPGRSVRKQDVIAVCAFGQSLDIAPNLESIVLPDLPPLSFKLTEEVVSEHGARF